MSVTLHTSLGEIKARPEPNKLDVNRIYRSKYFARPYLKRQRTFSPSPLRANTMVAYSTRNIKSFMIQTGDPTGTGKGGQSIYGKPFADEVRSTLKFNARGVVAMANSGPDTNKAQFFITYAKQPHLDTKYSIFGRVIDGLDTTLDAMERVPVNEKMRPTVPIKLERVEVHANPIAEKALQ
ncbi:peptidyl-prolyl cis-trans isomerase-like 3 [Microbotryum lychnidis-dioicae p1A1 Lamole]|uniref:Peptidyl-prolyl cis-trans isomerase n=1 Tax=Microbotryum lychnidis-dioicae (strain p1A1 Lamole / MvSl-1064) TaxID=683840 RepID=U5HG36_USTV1|nr:peptidyl-prolyl cis-trans isomerase-like 3 [Microbotryum lychnidis-dioicae p1A1 Lamole]|eukprot:KDE03445.1 peptidyl-prolyl cis-trans isomerase-like 3 [Microbotryum lychnidis-dioicae p1A1 Lamole]